MLSKRKKRKPIIIYYLSLQRKKSHIIKMLASFFRKKLTSFLGYRKNRSKLIVFNMKVLILLLLLVSFDTFSQSGYYYFGSLGKMVESTTSRNQMLVSYEFYADTEPACPIIYNFLDVNYPLFDYIINSESGCIIEGPFATKEEAMKARKKHIGRMRVNQSYMITNTICDDKRIIAQSSPTSHSSQKD